MISRPKDIAKIVAHVHQGAIDVLGPVVDPVTVHQAKFSMPATLGLIAVHRRAGMAEFDGYLKDAEARSFLDRVEMVLDPEVDAAYPNRWIGKVSVTTTSGQTLDGRVDEPKGDPGNTLSRDEIDAKARRLAAYGKSLDDVGHRPADAEPLVDHRAQRGRPADLRAARLDVSGTSAESPLAFVHDLFQSSALRSEGALCP